MESPAWLKSKTRGTGHASQQNLFLNKMRGNHERHSNPQ
jgi:hypothetical protein